MTGKHRAAFCPYCGSTTARQVIAEYWRDRLGEILNDRFSDGTPVLPEVLRQRPDLALRLKKALAA